MLKINNYHVSYGQSEILHGINIDVKPGEIVAVTGRNGMGKTTLMKSIMGIIPPTEGPLTIGDKDISSLVTHERVREGVAYVPQGRMIFATMTVEENIETGLAGTDKKKIPDEIYDIFPVLLEMKDVEAGIWLGVSSHHWPLRVLLFQNLRSSFLMSQQKEFNHQLSKKLPRYFDALEMSVD